MKRLLTIGLVSLSNFLFAQYLSFQLMGQDTINAVDTNRMQQGKYVYSIQNENAQKYKLEEGKIVAIHTRKEQKQLAKKGYLRLVEERTYYKSNIATSANTRISVKKNVVIQEHERRNLPHERITGSLYNYYPNGKIKEILNYQNGVLQGDSRFFDKHGKLKAIYYFEEGNVKWVKYARKRQDSLPNANFYPNKIVYKHE